MNDTHDANRMTGGASNSLKEAVRAHQEGHESDLDRYRHTGARLLENTQARLARAEHDYQMGRARILADAKMQLDALQQRTRDELRTFDLKRSDEIGTLQEAVQTLQIMRDVGD